MTPATPAIRFDPFAVELSGKNVVTASAGTGKTYAITALVVRLVAERALDIRRILVVTFTEAATVELKDRIRQKLRDAVQAYKLSERGGGGDADLDRYVAGRGKRRRVELFRLERALEGVDEAPISTIHGFCRRVLEDGALESSVRYDAELVTDLSSLRDEVLHDAWTLFVADQPSDVLERVEKHLLPARLRGIADKITRSPDLPVLADDFESMVRSLFVRLKAMWATDRGIIEQEFREKLRSPGTKPDTIVKWFEQVDVFLRSSPEIDALPVGIRRLGGQDAPLAGLPSHPFFLWCRRLRRLVSPRRPNETSSKRSRTPELVRLERCIIDYVRAELPRRKEERGILAFDDLLLSLSRALTGPGGERLARSIRERFEAALIDEFQDTDPIQLSIFDRIYGGTTLPVFLIGDPKQAIYAFRGADVFTYLGAVSAPGIRRHTMGVSWRADPSLLSAVNALFRIRPRAPPPFLLRDIEYPVLEPRPKAKDLFRAGTGQGSEALEVLFARSAQEGSRFTWKEEIPRLVAAEVSSSIRSGASLGDRPVTAADIAILTRRNDQCFAIQDELRLLEIPAVVLGDRSVFESRDAADLQRVLAAIVEPSPVEMRRALASELVGASANQMARMETEPALWDFWALRFREWNRLWTERGFVQMFDAFLVGGDIPERLLRLVDGDRRMTNLLHLMELLRTASEEFHLGPAGLLHWLSVQRSDPTKQAEHAEIRLESDEAAVKLTTIHKAKGLEYPVVYCPYLWDGALLFGEDEIALRFHDPKDGNRLKLDLGSVDFPEHRDMAALEALAENVRLLYVALTRAKHKVTLVWGAFDGMQQSALGALLHPPELAHGESVTIQHFEGRRVDEDQALAALAAWKERSGGAVGVRFLDRERRGEIVRHAPPAGSEFTLREPRHDIRGFHSTMSFSGLSAAGPREAPELTPGRDRDEASGAAGGAEGSVSAPIVLADFARGAGAGTFYHSVLERLDFRDLASLRPLVEERLRDSGYDVEPWADPVCRSVRDVLETRLFSDRSGRLADVSSDRRLNELEFHLPVADSPGATLPSAAAFGEVFAAHPSEAVPRSYAARLARLGFSRLEGYLKGYIDLVFEHDGRFYVVDYKTNFLGPSLGDYAAENLPAAMAHGQYYLQYHLYTVAVDRYLGRRSKSYRYEDQFGGALYLFVRGMSPERGPSAGVFFERPPAERIRALGALLDGRHGEAA